MATTGITIAEAIQEAVDTIYEMGRWPGMTRELPLTDGMFSFDAESGEYTISFDEPTYDGVVGFRNRQRGWSIVDQVALYKDGVNAGDMEFVDLGTVDVIHVTLGGELTPDIAGLLVPCSQVDGVDAWSDDGEDLNVSVWNDAQVGFYFNGSQWVVRQGAFGWVTTDGDSSTPFGWTWIESSGGGTLTVTETPIQLRKYRCPLGWSLDGGPYFALMKLEAPTLEADSLIPVESLKALKCAIQAVCYEYVSDEDRANLCWQKFEMFMSKSEKQVHGPKRLTMGMDSSLRRRPSQFS